MWSGPRFVESLILTMGRNGNVGQHNPDLRGRKAFRYWLFRTKHHHSNLIYLTFNYLWCYLEIVAFLCIFDISFSFVWFRRHAFFLPLASVVINMGIEGTQEAVSALLASQIHLVNLNSWSLAKKKTGQCFNYDSGFSDCKVLQKHSSVYL